jgi:hypothetical protein
MGAGKREEMNADKRPSTSALDKLKKLLSPTSAAGSLRDADAKRQAEIEKQTSGQ